MILMSVQPKWCEKIVNGEKTIEIRTKKPAHPDRLMGCKVYVYCTLNKGVLMPDILQEGRVMYLAKASARMREYWNQCYNNKVIGEFTFDGVEEFDKFKTGKRITIADRKKLCDKSCVPFGKIEKYADGHSIYLWHIKDFKLYDEPKRLDNYFVPGECDEDCNYCSYQRSDIIDGKWFNYCVAPGGYKKLMKPPISWCYAESIDRLECERNE